MAKKTILIVDDEYLILESNKEILKKAGFNVFTATSGKEALRKIKSRKIDLALLDVLMPEMTGIDLAKKIRKNSKLNDVKLVFLTILSFSNDQRRELKKYNITDYIQKPFDTEELLNKIDKLLKA